MRLSRRLSIADEVEVVGLDAGDLQRLLAGSETREGTQFSSFVFATCFVSWRTTN